MLKNHLRTAWRRLTREKPFPTLSVFGLAISLAACGIIGLFVADELGYDRFNHHADRIFRVAADLRINGGTIHSVATPAPTLICLPSLPFRCSKAIPIPRSRRPIR